MNTENSPNTPGGNASVQDVLEHAIHLTIRVLKYWPILLVAAVVGVPVFFYARRLVPPVWESSTVLLYREMIQADVLLATPTESRRSRDVRLREMALSRGTLLPIIVANGLLSSTLRNRGETAAVEELRSAVRVAISEGNTMTITYRGASPKEVFQVTKAVADAIVEKSSQLAAEQTNSALVFLENQLADSSKELLQAEQRYAEFLAQHPDYALRMDGKSTFAGIAALTGTRAQPTRGWVDPAATLQSQAERLKVKIQEASRVIVPPENSPPALPERDLVESSPAMVEAERELRRAQEALLERQSRFTEKHPDVIAARATVARAQSRIASVRIAHVSKERASAVPPSGMPGAESAAAPGGLPSVAELQAQLRQVQAAIALNRNGASPGQKADSVRTSGLAGDDSVVMQETEWASINRSVALARERTEQLQRQLFKSSLVAKIQNSGSGRQMLVVDQAYEPKTPVARGSRRVGAVGFAAVMVLGLAIAVALVLMDDRLYGISELKRLGIGPIAQVVPAQPSSDKEA